MEFSSLETFTALEYEQPTATNARRSAPEKHLDSPICTGLLTRLDAILDAAYEDDTDRTPDWNFVRRYLDMNPEVDYSSIRKPL